MSERHYIVLACPECGEQVACDDLEHRTGQIWECPHGMYLRPDGTYENTEPVRVEFPAPSGDEITVSREDMMRVMLGMSGRMDDRPKAVRESYGRLLAALEDKEER